MKTKLYILLLSPFCSSAYANVEEVSVPISVVITDFFEFILTPIVSFLAFVFLGGEYEIFGEVKQITILGIPLLVAWLLVGAVFFTFKLRFVNLRLFKHAIDVVRGKYRDPDAPGKVTHLQALFTAVAATVGLGNIAGVAIAVSLGGPGAVIWMMIAAFFGMSTKFAEVTLGQKYRRFEKGHLYAGSFYYLEDGFKEKGYVKTGQFFGKFSAILCIGGAIGGGLMFQANQSAAIIADSFNLGSMSKFIFILLLSGVIGAILLGGITRIASLAEKVVPLMACIYIISCIIILLANYSNVVDAVRLMFHSAFSENALYGGIIGAIVQGFKRAAFSNEAGIGSAPIAHAAAKTKEPIREGSVALLEPFIDTITICFMTGIVIVVTGSYENANVDEGGVLITKAAFATVSSWFPYILSLAVFLFAFSTMLTYSYYGQQAWLYLTHGKKVYLCHLLFVFFIFVGGMMHLGIVIDFADILFLSMAIPNLIGLYVMSGNIKEDTDNYIFRLKSGEFSNLVYKNETNADTEEKQEAKSES